MDEYCKTRSCLPRLGNIILLEKLLKTQERLYFEKLEEVLHNTALWLPNRDCTTALTVPLPATESPAKCIQH